MVGGSDVGSCGKDGGRSRLVAELRARSRRRPSATARRGSASESKRLGILHRDDGGHRHSIGCYDLCGGGLEWVSVGWKQVAVGWRWLQKEMWIAVSYGFKMYRWDGALAAAALKLQQSVSWVECGSSCW